MSLTKSICASFVSFVIFVVGFVRRRLQIAANSNRRRSVSMETCPAEILLIRPPAPGRERAQAGPPEPEQRRPEARPGGQPALAKAAHWRASGDQGTIMHFRISNGSNVLKEVSVRPPCALCLCGGIVSC
jgi:hypothetical protein